MQRTIQMRTAQAEVREEKDLSVQSVDAVSTASLSLFCPIRPLGA